MPRERICRYGLLMPMPTASTDRRPDAPKRAEQIAIELESEILAGRWLPDTRIGNESDLVARFGVSRWTMREAIAILEQAGILTARRGLGGGLFVTGSAQTMVRNSLCAYLELSLTSFEAVASVRLELTRKAIELARQRMSVVERAELAGLVLAAEEPGQEAVEAMSRAHTRLREMSGNRLLDLFIAVLDDVIVHACWLSSLDDDTFVGLIDDLTVSSRRFFLAVLADRPDLAMEFETRSLAIEARLHSSSGVSGQARSAPNAFDRSYALYPSPHSGKKAERVAWSIRRDIAERQLSVGTIIGSEESLMRDNAVGRPVLREAIRILERLGAVAMRRGGASGLTVTHPDPRHIVALARAYFVRNPVTSPEIAEVIPVVRALSVASNPVAEIFCAILED